MKRLLTIGVFLLIQPLFAAPGGADSLRAELASARTDSARMALYVQLAKQCVNLKSDSAFVYFDRAIELARKLNATKTLFDLYQSKGTAYSEWQHFALALFEFKQQLDAARQLADSALISSAYSNAGSVLNSMGLTERAITAYISALQYHSPLSDSLKTAILYGRIGNLHLTAIKYNDAEAYYRRALEIFEKKGLKRYMTIVFQNMGVIEKNRGNYASAVALFGRAGDLHSELGNTLGVAQCIGNIGGIYYEQGNYPKAIETIGRAIEVFRKQKARYDLAIALLKQGKSYYHLKNFERARLILEEGLGLSDSTLQPLQVEQLEALANTYSSLGMHQRAFETLYKAYNIYAKLHTIQSSQIEESLRIEMEIERREKDMQLLQKDNELKESTIRRQNAQLMFYLSALGLFLVVVAMLVRINRVRKIANAELLVKNAEITQQKEEIEAQRDEIEAQKEEIMSQRDQLEVQRSLAISQRDKLSRVNTALTDSIQYAKNIQTALLPSAAELSEGLGENFVFYEPLNIVSGDFYWVSTPNSRGTNETFLAVADCTGHGVPGALMSVMGINFLNSIVNENGVSDPAAILAAVDESIGNALSHTNEHGKNKDGMDMAAVLFDWQTMELAYCSAKIRVLVWRKGEVIQLEAAKVSLGKTGRETNPFETKVMSLQPNDVVYLLTDGYIDQFGGPNYKKFLLSQLIELIKRLGLKPMAEQRKALADAFWRWKGSNIQIDDVLVVAIKI